MAAIDILDLYLDPATIKASALTDLQDRLMGGEGITDANNVPMWFLERTSSLISNAMLNTKTYVDVSAYKKKATEFEDLYRHMSDYDFIGLYATPAPSTFVVELELSYLRYNAVTYSSQYRKVVIPASTVFTFGDYQFGIYYPINLLININSGIVTAEWDTSEDNPLLTLENTSIDLQQVTEDSIDYIQLRIPVYQFSKVTKTFAASNDTGLVEQIEFDNNFYAIRAFHKKDSVWIPLTVSLSKTVYDLDDPTVQFIVDQDNQKVSVVVPPIYFTKELISNSIKIEVFTSMGELDININSVDSDGVTIDFKTTESDTYSTVLNKISSIPVYFENSYITGGSNGLSFDELKEKVINNDFDDEVIISPSAVSKYFSNLGFTSTRYAANITNMTFLCHKQLTNSKGEIIAGGHIPIKIDADIIAACDTIIENTDNSITILPSTIFEYDSVNDICIPMTTADVTALSSLSKLSRAEQYNENIYTVTPFHIRLDMATRYPMAYSYDLNNPKSQYLHTTAENTGAEALLKIYAVAISHDGSTGYDIKLLVANSGEFTYENVRIMFYTYNVSGGKIWTEATYYGAYEDKFVFNIHIDTNYCIFATNTMYLTTMRTDAGQYGHDVDLSFDGNFVLLLEDAYVNTEGLSPNMGQNVPVDEFSGYTPIVEQQSTITLGTYLSGILNDVDVSYTDIEYAKYEVNVPLTATEVMYEYDENDLLVYTIVDGKPVYTVKYNIGDTILDDEGNPRYKHLIGETVIQGGVPVIAKDRTCVYYVGSVQVDGKLNIVTDNSYTNILTYTREKLLTYLAAIEEASDSMLEATQLYFTPTKTIGVASSYVGNNVSYKHNLELTMSFKIYTYDYVAKDESIKTVVYNNIVSLIDEYTGNNSSDVVSMDVIISLIKEELSEYVLNIDVYGFFDDSSLQTLIMKDEKTKPQLKHLLVIDDAGVITVTRGLTLEFVTL